jgi:ketosteroid isomerase-like protein
MTQVSSPPGVLLEQRVARLEDVRSIQEVKYRYTEGTDTGYDLDKIASAFTPDGRWVAEGFADCHGREEIKEFFAGLKQVVTMALHHATNPRIQVAEDGLSATGQFYLHCLCTMLRGDDSGGSDAVLMIGTYRDRFAKVDGEWLLDELVADVRHVSEWTEGWARQPWRT